ncbi:MAG: hypothetical protein JWO95_1364 [Verrucomicrobiales bacterium]|nr:hypothetical protein [Verrucomicrobiales bacterium]
MSKPAVVITSMPPRTQSYFDWLLTGLGVLQEEGRATLRFEDRWWNRALRAHPKVMAAAWRMGDDFVEFVSPMDAVCLTGRVELADKVVSFAMDVADAPFNFALGHLEAADLYFKCQCPKSFEPEGYPLNRHVRIPYHPEVFRLQEKIRPGMLGRPLAVGTNLKKNLRVLRQWESAAAPRKDVRIFASFAHDRGVKPRTSRDPLPSAFNYESENSLIKRWGDSIHHPNRKRERIVEMLRRMEKADVNARIWRTENAAVGGPMLSDAEYREMVGRAAVVVNVSGLRRSLPFRFMDAFMSGAAVATDTIGTRWPKPWESGTEIFEFGDLGYELDEEVDWKAVGKRFHEIYDWAGKSGEHFKVVQDLYRKKWAPQVYAGYVVDECLKTMEERS